MKTKTLFIEEEVQGVKHVDLNIEQLIKQVVKNIDGYNEHIFVATPTMLITTYKTDNTNRYTVNYLKRKYVNRYNKYIAQNSSMIITKNALINIENLLS